MRTWVLALLGVGVLATGIALARPGEEEETTALLKELPKAKHTLSDGIRQAAAKAPAVAISAKFELDDNKKLSLSVYTAGKGLGGDAEENVLQEVVGSPEVEKWTTETEVFKDVEHVARSAQQLTLMALAPSSLLDVIAKAEKDHPGTVFSVKPKLEGRKARFEVIVAAGGKAQEYEYDLLTGNAIPAEPAKGEKK